MMADDDIDASEGLEGQRGGEEQEIGKVDICRFHLLAQSPCWSQYETTKRESQKRVNTSVSLRTRLPKEKANSEDEH